MAHSSRRWELPVVAALVALGAVGRPAAHAKDAPPKAPVADAALVEAIDAAVTEAGGGAFWGVVVAAKGGQVVFAKGYGAADYASRPNAPDTLFEIASASKQVTATAVLRLEQQKKLRTTDTLDRFFRDAPADKRKVTLDHLLRHTAGLDKELGVPYAWQGTRDAYVRQMLAPPLAAEPGAAFSYSNVGYALLAAVVEVASGSTFEDYVRKELFAPAGMKDTGFVRDPALVRSPRVSRRACDDCAPGWTAADWFWGWGYRGMGGVVTTGLDLVAWDRALRGGKVLGPAALEKLHTVGKDGYACGWFVETTERGTRKAHHAGGVRGYACQVARYLEDDVFVAVLSNGRTDPHAVEAAVAARLLPRAALTLTVDVTGLPLNPWRGLESDDVRWEVATARGECTLTLRLGDRAVATLRGPDGLRAKVAGDLERALAASTYATPDDPPATTGGVYLALLGEGAGTAATLSEGLAVRVLPRYEGRTPDGQPVEDLRTVLLVESSGDVRGWPVMTKLNPKAVRALVEALRR